MSLTTGRDVHPATDTSTGEPHPAAAEMPGAREWVFDVVGMSCASCAARIERRLARLDGVSARVNLATDQALVTAVAGMAPETVAAAIERLGYRARLHTAPEDEHSSEGEAGPDGQDRVAGLWRRLVVALCCGAPLADASMTFALAPQWRFPGWQILLLALTVPVLGYSAAGFYRGALAAARTRTSSMDTLIALGVLAAAGWSLYAMTALPDPGPGAERALLWSPSGSLYLDVAAGVVCFALAGRLWEAKARRSAGSALRALAARTAREATRLGPDGVEERIPAAALQVGDRFLVRPGELVPADGTVLAGASALDTSALTGESRPRPVERGDHVRGGCVVLDGRLEVTATRVGADTTWAQLVELVERAQHDKATIARLTDRISAVFVPVVIALAFATAGGWLLAGGDPQNAVQAGIAVLIVACPCALGLATPTALLVASGRCAELGVFLKGHHGIEVAGAIDTVVLDKTGTLTTGAGAMTVVDTATNPGSDPDTLLRVTAALERSSEHPTAHALVEFAAAAAPQPTPRPVVRGFAARAGLGVSGWVDEHRVVIGSPRLLAELGLREPTSLTATRSSWQQDGLTPVMVGVDGLVAGGFALSDTLRPSAAGAVAELARMGLRTVLLSGDSATVTTAVAEQLGIDEVAAEVLPADKAATITSLQNQGRRVAMVGDGINDAPALAGADLGLALLSGTDVALSAADVILVGDDLAAIPTAIRLARRTRTTIRGNLAWAFGYNLAAVPIAALGLLNPVIAAAAMALSSAFVLANSLRLRRFTPTPEPGSPTYPATARTGPAAVAGTSGQGVGVGC